MTQAVGFHLTPDTVREMRRQKQQLATLVNAGFQTQGPGRPRNWQQVRFCCEKPDDDGIYCGKVLRWDGGTFEDIGDCRIKTDIVDPETVSAHDAVQIGAIDGEPLFYVAPTAPLCFELLGDLFRCSSAPAVPVYFDGEQRCRVEGDCPGGSGSGSGSDGGSGYGDASLCSGHWGPESGSGSGTSGLYVYDGIGLRVPPRRRPGSGSGSGDAPPGLIGIRGDLGWAEWRADSQRFEVVALGISCCNQTVEPDTGCCETDILLDVDVSVDAVLDSNTCQMTITVNVEKTIGTLRYKCCDE